MGRDRRCYVFHQKEEKCFIQYEILVVPLKIQDEIARNAIRYVTPVVNTTVASVALKPRHQYKIDNRQNVETQSVSTRSDVVPQRPLTSFRGRGRGVTRPIQRSVAVSQPISYPVPYMQPASNVFLPHLPPNFSYPNMYPSPLPPGYLLSNSAATALSPVTTQPLPQVQLKGIFGTVI